MSGETVAALLAANAASRGQADAIVDPQRGISWAGLNEASANRAAQLVETGINKGLRVALMAENSVDWVDWACAVMRIGAVLVPLSTMLRGPEIESQIRIAGVRHLIFQPEIRGRDMHAELAALDRSAAGDLLEIGVFDLDRNRTSGQRLGFAASPDLGRQCVDLSPCGLHVENILGEGVLRADRLSLAMRFHRAMVDPARNVVVPAARLPEMRAQELG